MWSTAIFVFFCVKSLIVNYIVSPVSSRQSVIMLFNKITLLQTIKINGLV